MSDATRALVGCRSIRLARAQRRPRTPAELGQRLILGFKITPTIAIISDALADAITEPDRRLIVTVGPREGKSTLVSQLGVLFMLMTDPDSSVILTSYGDDLAREHSHKARALISEHADLLGFQLSSDKSAVGRWRVDGRRGGLLASGILSGVTGFGADGLLVLDDVLKNAEQADSASHRRKVLAEFRGTLLTRCMPGASVVIVQTRWAPTDLVGTLLAEEPDTWRCINVPAISEAGIPDALGRAPGVAMVSAIGRTPEQFDDIRKSVGARVWSSLFQGSPSPLEGGLILRSWLDQWRLPVAPTRATYTVIGVDPAETGDRDEAGIVAASITSDGVVAVIADRSKPMTSAEWSRAAVELAVDVGASEIAVEGFAAARTYVEVVKAALKRYRTDRHIRVTSWPPKGSGRGGGDSLARSSALLQGLEVGTCRIAGYLPDLEAAAVNWQRGQHQPDALAALTIAFDVLTHATGRRMTFADPMRSAARIGSPEVASMVSYLTRRIG